MSERINYAQNTQATPPCVLVRAVQVPDAATTDKTQVQGCNHLLTAHQKQTRHAKKLTTPFVAKNEMVLKKRSCDPERQKITLHHVSPNNI